MAINWNNIRPLNNSRNDGFEELVCQLAGKEKIVGQKKFQRIGRPDGGKECFWLFENGDVYAWQAKYFITSFSNTQWTEINDSVISVIDNHPKLRKYFIAIPFDMPDGKVNGRKSLLGKWNEKVSIWKNYALSKGIDLEIGYWGSYELLKRLSYKENEGLKYFWFNEEEFTDEWFAAKNKESINALGARYTSDLNFDLPIAKVFNGLARNDQFEDEVNNYYKKLLEKYRRLRMQIEHEEIKELLSQLEQLIYEFKLFYKSLYFKGNQFVPFNDITTFLNLFLDKTDRIYEIVLALREDKEKVKQPYYSNRPFSSELNELSRFNSAINDFINFVNSPTCRLANTPSLIIEGEAGMGKSHLLADIINKRCENNQPSLFLLGENFSTKEMPWTQILNNQLRKSQIDEFVFLGALNAKAESYQSRMVIFIDALNEGEGRFIWPKRLKSFIENFQKYPWIGLVVTIRTSYVNLIAKKEDIKNELAIRVIHEGFLGFDFEATKSFFKYYNIMEPSSPLLYPEFISPLFLKLFCLSLYNKGLHEVPKGYEGITMIINSFLESIDSKLALPENLYYDENKRLVRKVVDEVLLEMVNSQNDYITYEKADQIVDSKFIGVCSKPEPFLKRLISEGVFNNDLYWDNKGNDFEVIRFAYNRFQDHLTVSMLLDKFLDTKNPTESFKKGYLHSLIKNKDTAHFNQNYVEALSVQIPERIGQELYEVAPHSKLYFSVAYGFINSLLWRKPESVNERSIDYVNKVICANDSLFYHLIEVSISNSMKSGFYFNSERLHIALLKFKLPERDKWWTTWLQNKYGRNTNYNSVKRLIDWAWSEEDKSYVSDESIRLGCITLSWFLTSSNRYLRDGATKALICLLQDRIQLIIPILNLFKDVNDPYVAERLYAVAYGCVLRSKNDDYLIELSEYVFKNIFDKDYIYPHILLRDYARGIIEFTINQNLHPEIHVDKIRPPYKSKKLPSKFPTNSVIDKKYKPQENTGNYGKENWGATAIISSMTTEYGRGIAHYGDFGRYTFQSAFSNWKINYDGLSNYAIQRIFEIGYDAKLFSQFDSQQDSGRGGGHNERIGKKYQWIIFHELLAQVSDQFPLFDESGRWDGTLTKYEGPWYPSLRDIDPTLVIKEIKGKYHKSERKYWWYGLDYANWTTSIKEWANDKSDLPTPDSIIEVKDEKGNEWLWLEIHPVWEEPEELGEDKYLTQRKELWYQIRSYFIKKDYKEKFEKDFKRDFYRYDLPEARRLSNIFSHEYFQSIAFNYYKDGEDWNEVYSRKTNKLVGEVLRTTEEFTWEEEFDCSKDGTITFYKPSSIIKRALCLDYTLNEGEFSNKAGEIICMDPAVNNNTISGLLIRKKELVEFLEKENLILMWSVIGEKQMLGGSWSKSEYNGRMNISGLYFLQDGKVNGNLRTYME